MKGKRANWICIGIISAVLVAAITAILVCVLKKENTEPEYTYEALSENLPEYDKDLFLIDGKLEEEIYNELRWWEETYSEGEMQEPVNVRSTAYMGENGVYFIFDVDDDNVNVDMKRSSWNNSGMTVYVAEEGTHLLEDNVWEIDLLPTDYINAKRYLGGYYYGTVRANGYENQPFVRTTTKGGDVNTPECKGYIMESYFPYAFLFKEGEKPENLNLNFSLQRSYSLESTARDVYYNFGQNVMSNWSWGDPGTWWTFHKMGLDSVDLIFDTTEGGTLEHRNDYIARYQTEKIKINPTEGYRIADLFIEKDGKYEDITNQITWEDGQNYIKVRNVTSDVKLKASFEKIPTTKTTISGKISGGKAEDLGVRFICGGVVYTAEVAGNGSYSLEVPTGVGVLEVYSKTYGYVAKRIDVTASSDAVAKNVKLTANDYGNKRVMSLSSEQVMGNKERLFNGEKMTGSMSKTFAYDFTLKYDGQLLEKDGTPVADPTFGEYDNQYTSINLKGAFTDADGKAIEKSDMQLQIMSWNGNGMWMVKMWLDSQYVEARLGIDELKAFGSEDGVSFRLIFADSKLSLCMVRGNNVYKITELKTKATADRYLKNIDFYAEHCINHSIWYVEDQSLALGRTEANSNITATVANGDGVVNFKKSTNGKLVRTATSWDANKFNGAFGWTGTLQVPGVLKNGKIQYHEMKTGYWVDTCKDDKDWYQFTVYIIGDGDSYYVTKNNQKTKLALTEEQIKLLGTTGLQVGAFVNGNAISYFVDNGKGEMVVFADLYDFNENQAWYPWPNKYGGAYLIHEGASKIGEVISTGAEFYTGLSKEMNVTDFVKNVLGEKYQSNQALNPVTHTFDSEKNNYFVMNHKDVKENAFYGYNIKLDELKNTSIYFNTKAWTKEYYASFVKLRVTEDSAYFIWQQGVSPYLCSEAVYFLNDDQIAKLTDGGLDIYVEYKDNSPELNLYVDDGTGKLVLASTYKDDLFRKSTGITEVKNLIGYSVEVENSETNVTVVATGCVIPDDGNFANSVKALYNKEIVSAEAAEDLIKIDSQKIGKSSEKINLDYYDFNIGGNWFDRFNVKLPDAVDKNGKILTTSQVKMTARLQGDEYYGQSLNLYLEEDGMGYLEFINYGGAWESYYYRLTDKQLAQLATKDGLNLFVGHKDNENQVTLYIAEDSTLLPLRTFAYGKTELWAKGYSASYVGDEKDRVEVTVECYKHEATLEAALKQAYQTEYKISDEKAFIYTDFMEASKEFDGKEQETVIKEHRKAGDPSIWQTVLKSDAVNAKGKVLKDSETLIVMFCNDWTYQFNTTLKLTKTESVLTLQEGELGNWKLHKYYLSQEQLAQLATEDGLKLYISYENKRVTVYVEESADTLAKVLTFSQPDIVMNDTRIRYNESKASMDALMSGYMYTNGTFIDAANTIYNNEYANIREMTKVEVAKVSSHTIDDASEKVNIDYGDATISGTWLDHFTVKLPEVVNEDGKILATAKVNMTAKMQGTDYYGQSLNLCLEKGGEGYLELANYGGDWEKYYYELTAAQLAQIASEEGLNLFAGHEETENKVTVYIAEGTDIIPVKTFTYGEKELRGKGYAASYEGDETNIEIAMDCYQYDGTVEETIQLVFDENAKISDDKVIVYTDFVNVSSEFDGKENELVDKKHRNATAPSVWQAILKSDAVDTTGKVLKTGDFILKEFCHNYYEFAVGLKLIDTETILTLQEGEVGGWKLHKYPLSKEQVARLASEDGLKFYLSHEEEQIIVYLEEDADTLVKALTFTQPELKMHTTRITYNQSETGMNVSVNGYMYENSVFVDAVNTIFNETYSVREKTILEEAVIEEHTIDAVTEKVNTDYGDVTISGTWLDRFSVKLPEVVDEDGKILATAKVNMTAKMQGSDYYGQGLNLYLEKGGEGYLELVEYGSWEKYYYELTADQLAQVASEEGLNLFAGHEETENKVTVYIAEGTEIIPVKTFTYGEKELRGKGYAASYEGDETNHIEVSATCYQYDGTVEETIQLVYDENAKISDESVFVYRNFMNASKAFEANKQESLTKDKLEAGDSSVWQIALKSDAVNAEGKVVKTSKTMMRIWCNNAYSYNVDTTLNLTDTESVLTLQSPTDSWKLHKYHLSLEQTARLASEEGLKLYVSYEDQKITVYLEETDTKLVKVLAYTKANLTMHDVRVTYYESAANMSAEVNGYTYENGKFLDATNTIFNETYSIREKNALESARLTMHTIDKPTESFKVEYTGKVDGQLNATGNWMQHFNVKSDGVEGTTVKLTTRMYGSEYYQQVSDIKFTENGAYLEVKQYGGQWTTYTYPLSANQLAQLKSEQGLDIYISCESAQKITIYFADEDMLVQVKEFTYGSKAIEGLGYVASYVGNADDKIQILAECLEVENSIVEACKTLYGKNYTITKRVQVNVTKQNAIVTGIKNSYHLGDTVSFTVQADEGYKLESVTLNNQTLNATNGSYQFVLTEDHVTSCNIQVNTILKKIYSFVSYTGTVDKDKDFSRELYEEQKIETLMNNGVYHYLFHTKLKSSSDNACSVFYKGWGTNYEHYNVKTEIIDNTWKLKFALGTDVTEIDLTDAQLEEIKETGLDIFLVNFDSTKYALYVENDDGTGVVKVGEVQSKLGNKKIYNVTHDKSSLTTNGYFYNGYTAEEVMQKLVSYKEFRSTTGNNADKFDTVTLNGTKITALMKDASYLFHTKFKLATIAEAEVKYTGWGDGWENYFIGIKQEGEVWYLSLNYSLEKLYNREVQEFFKVALSQEQIDEIIGNGLDVFFVKSGAKQFTVYVENNNQTDVVLVSDFTLNRNNYQIYQVKNSVADFTTKGYFYQNFTTAQEAAKNLYDIVK